MKNCQNCGTQTLDVAESCDTCGAIYAQGDGAAGSVVFARPDGSGAKSIGLMSALLGALALVVSVAGSSGDLGLKATLSLVGGALLQIGLIVWLAGYIVHAISFLPGRQD